MGIKWLECDNETNSMRCGNTSYRVVADTKELFCIKCKNRKRILFADGEGTEKPKEVPPVPDFANKQNLKSTSSTRHTTSERRPFTEETEPDLKTFVKGKVSEKDEDKPIEITDPIDKKNSKKEDTTT